MIKIAPFLDIFHDKTAVSIILSALIGYIISDVIFMPLRGTSRYIVSGRYLNRGIGCTGVVIQNKCQQLYLFNQQAPFNYATILRIKAPIFTF